MKTVVQALASAFDAWGRCVDKGNHKWAEHWEDCIDHIEKEILPSGSGFDDGTTFHKAQSDDKKLVFETGFHHMNEHGSYLRWSHHNVIVTPTFDGVDIKVTGENYRDIKDLIAETFYHALTSPYQELDKLKELAIKGANPNESV